MGIKTLLVALCLSIFSLTSYALNPIIVDADGSGGIGAWQTSGGADPYAGSSIYSTGNNSSYSWDLNIEIPGEYELFVWWTYYNNRTTEAHYQFDTDTRLETIIIDQRQQSQAGQWVSLGRFPLSSITTITVSNPSGVGTLSADAVKAQLIETNQTSQSIIADADQQYGGVGSWSLSSGPNPYNGSSLYSSGSGNSYSWNLSTQSTEYEIFVWWTYYNNRTVEAQYQFNTSNGIETVLINQRDEQQAGRWLSLGRHQLSNSTTITVSNPSGEGTLSADAVKLEPVIDSTPNQPPVTEPPSEPPSESVITVDANANNGIGIWAPSSGPNPYNGSSIYSSGSGSSYQWDITIASAGVYELRVWWTYWSNRTTDAHYQFNTANGSETVVINQRDESQAGQWVSLGHYSLSAGTTSITVNNPSGVGTLSADAVQALVSNSDPTSPQEPEPKHSNVFIDDFTSLDSFVGYVTNNPSALPDVSYYNGRYRAVLTDNTNDITLHFRNKQGRLDARLAHFPFTAIARNIGIGQVSNSQTPPSHQDRPYIFAGLQVHVTDLDSRNSSHVVVGHRGGTYRTIEGKNTVNGSSSVNDEGTNASSSGRADIMIVGTADRRLVVYWQAPNLNWNTQPDNWQLYRGTGQLPGTAPNYGESVYVGLITYAQGTNGLPFVGTADYFSITE